MPLVRIDVIEGRSEEDLRRLADTVQDVLVEHFAAPERDRYQVIHEHRAGRIIALDTGLGFERTDESSSSRSPSRAATTAEEGDLRRARRAARGPLRPRPDRPPHLHRREHPRRLVLRARPRAVPRGRSLAARPFGSARLTRLGGAGPPVGRMTRQTGIPKRGVSAP